MCYNNERNNNRGFEIEMRTTLTKLGVQQEELAKDVRDYLTKTVEQEVAISQMHSEITTLFKYHKDLKQELLHNQEDISRTIDDKISSLYKLTSITAFIVSTVVAIIGAAISTH